MVIDDLFINGINYWPISKAMYWWSNFDREELERDFSMLANFRFNVIRIFLTWEDFQPEADIISRKALDYLGLTVDLAEKYNLRLMPTFFCGHMSGVNWFPKWMLEGSKHTGRFPVYSQGKIQSASIKNYYHDDELLKSQIFQIREVCSVLKGSKAVICYDLGNESSNCIIPLSRTNARHWLKQTSDAIKKYSGNLPVTIGMHAEDLEEDRRLWPQDAAIYCDFLCMHGYPFYLSWVEDSFDVNVLPFLGLVTEWLGKKPVLFQEFGAPSVPLIAPFLAEDYQKQLKCPLYQEKAVKTYYQRAVAMLKNAGMIGAMAWCFADYSPDLWDREPLKQNLHERHFGLFRHNASSKAQADIFLEADFEVEKERNSKIDRRWLEEFDPDQYYNDPKNNLQIMYKKYKEFITFNS